MVSEPKMREILFRGKRTKAGEWVEGLLFHHCEKASSIWSDELDRAVWVAPETVGQFTGLTDKNGKKIFEGDIVRCIRTMCDGAKMVGHIVFDDCCFAVKEPKTPNQPAMDLCDDFEIIGNIHDNPELLEVSHA